MNPRYLQRFGEPPPFGDTIARAALRDDPDAAYGKLPLGENEGQRLFEQPDTKPLMTKDSMVAADDPYANYGAESGNDAGARQSMQPQYGSSTKPNLPAPVNDPYLNYDPEVPIRGERKLFQPPPTIESNAAKSIVLSEGEPKIDPERLSQPSQELPTAPPPESTLQRLIRQRLDNKLPERGPVSKWAKLAAVALGAGQGYYNAANPNARPIDASEAVQNLTFGRKYLDAMDKYQRTNKNLDEQIKLVGDAEDIESKIAERLDKQNTRNDINKDRDDIRIANNFKMGVEFAKSGSVVVPRGSPLTPGAVRIDANPLDPTGKTVVDVMPTGRQRIITDARVAKALGRKLNDPVSEAEYIQGAKEVWEYDKAIELENIKVKANPDYTTDYKDFLLAKKEGYKGTYLEYRSLDANLRKTQFNNFQMPNYAPGADGAANPVIEMYAKYRKTFPPPPTRNPQAMAAWNEQVKQITLVNPKFNPETGSRAIKDFSGSGKANQNLLAINTAANHISDLEDAIKAKGSGDIKMINRVIQSYQRNTGDTTQSDIDTIIPLLTQEISKAYMTSGGTVDERNTIAESLNAAKGYNATHTALARTVRLFYGRISALKSQYERDAAGNKWEDQPFVSAEAQAAFDRFVPKGPNPSAGPGRSGGGPTTHFEINGQPYDIPNEKVAAFKVAKGLK